MIAVTLFGIFFVLIVLIARHEIEERRIEQTIKRDVRDR